MPPRTIHTPEQVAALREMERQAFEERTGIHITSAEERAVEVEGAKRDPLTEGRFIGKLILGRLRRKLR